MEGFAWSVTEQLAEVSALGLWMGRGCLLGSGWEPGRVWCHHLALPAAPEAASQEPFARQCHLHSRACVLVLPRSSHVATIHSSP